MVDVPNTESQDEINIANEYTKKQITKLISVCSRLSKIKTGLFYLALNFNNQPEIKNKLNFKKSILTFCAIIIAGHNEKFYYSISNIIVDDIIRNANKIETLFNDGNINEIYNFLQTEGICNLTREFVRLTRNNMIYQVVANDYTFYLPKYDEYSSVGTHNNKETCIPPFSKLPKQEEKKKNRCLNIVLLIIIIALIAGLSKGCIHRLFETKPLQKHFKAKALERLYNERDQDQSEY